MQADITAVVGSTGTGKTYWMLAELARRRPARLLIWDAEDEFSKHGAPATRAADLIRLTAGDRFAVVYSPPFDRAIAQRAFSLFCRIAFERAPCLVLVDELADVVQPGSAPEGWNQIVRRGRKRGVSIIASSQRPAAIDKTFWSLASRVRCGRLGYVEDQRTIAAALAVPLEQVQALAGFEALENDRNAAPSRPIDRSKRPRKVDRPKAVSAGGQANSRKKDRP